MWSNRVRGNCLKGKSLSLRQYHRDVADGWRMYFVERQNTAIGAIESDHLDRSFLVCRFSLRCRPTSCFACSGWTTETEARRTEVPFLFLTYLTEANYWRGSNLGAFFSVKLYYLSIRTLLCTRYNRLYSCKERWFNLSYLRLRIPYLTYFMIPQYLESKV